MNLKLGAVIVVTCSMLSSVMAEGPQVSLNGYLDADGWADFNGAYYTNTELDLGLTVKFSDAVSAHVYATANGVYSKSGAGNVPAGLGRPTERWLTMNFDGFDITYESPVGTFSVGDIVYQYGKFNYYFYKRKSMITTESFSRGIKYSLGGGNFTQDLQIGIADFPNDSTADVNGASTINISEGNSVGVFYGIRGDSRLKFSEGTDFFAGAEYKGSFGDALSVKLDVGYNSIGGKERSNLTTILVEPTLSLGKFSVAATAFFGLDEADSVNLAGDVLGIADEMFFYIEPGYSFTDVFAFGLPLEYHDVTIDIEDDEAFWIVPTVYVYPSDNVQWWIWGQIGKPTVKDSKPFYGFGSEIIVTF